jgi:hypothetical protein
VRLAGTLYSLYDKDIHIDRIIALLDKAQPSTGEPPPAQS